MFAPSQPLDEAERLRRLTALNVLDTPREERFDRYTRLAAALFDAPIAAVSFVDSDRVWFKSAIGLDVEEVDRDVSFCGHAILDAGVTATPDAAADERFADNPLVADLDGIRFYAACPIPEGLGSPLGALCVMDRKPRNPGAEQLRLLGDLGAMLSREIVTHALATRDEVTKVANRASLLTLAEREVERARVESYRLTALLVDIEGFRSINECFGREEGDAALRDVASCLQAAMRSTDLVGRIGVDQFCALLPRMSRQHLTRGLHHLRGELAVLGADRGRGYDLELRTTMIDYDPHRHFCFEDLLIDGDDELHAMKRVARARRERFYEAEMAGVVG